MKVLQFYPVTLRVDGEEIDLRVKRMTFEENSEFMARMTSFGTPTYARFVSRGTSAEEQVQDDKGAYAIPFEKIAERKLEELSQDKRAEYEKAVEADEAESKKFLLYVFEEFVTVAKGLTEELSDGVEQSVSSGIDLLPIFVARQDVIQKVLDSVWRENMLSTNQKKILRSPSDSSPSLGEPDPAQAGPKPETIASSAATEGSADNGDATKNQQDPSGLTDPTPLDPAQSSH